MNPLDSPTPIISTPPRSAVSLPIETSDRRWLLWLAGGLAILFFGIVIGFFGAKFLNQSQGISQLPQTPIPTQSLAPTLTSDPTANWKTYQSQVATFKYPPDWRLDTNGKRITSTSPTIDLWVFGKDDPMMNECMDEKNRKSVNNLLIKYFSHVQGTEACSNRDTWSQKEIWIVKTEGDGFQPGIIYKYSSDRLTELEAIFDQIFSTFKFTAPDPTADWKTYTNTKYGFSFKRPDFDEKCCDLAGAVSDNPTEVITLADITTIIPNSDAPFDGLAIYIIPNENNLTLDQYIEQEKTALFEQFKIMADPNMTHKGQVVRAKVADQPAVSLVDYSWDGITRTYFNHPNSKVIIEISKKEKSLNHFTFYNQILSTFKFTAPDPTADWKTYTDHTFNFSIKYPNNWTAECKNPEGDWSSGTICDLRAPNTKIDHGQLLSGASIGVGVEKPNQNYKTLEEKIAFDTKNYDYQSTAKTINNIEGYLYTSPSNSAFVAKNGNYFVVVSWIPLSNTNQYKDTVDQILSTFGFVDK